MTASLFVTGTHVVGVGSGHPAGHASQAGAHAVAKPVVDGLELSLCGLLVTAVADQDWPVGVATPRCEECARIAGR
jgi:hypothetical protein